VSKSLIVTGCLTAAVGLLLVQGCASPSASFVERSDSRTVHTSPSPTLPGPKEVHRESVEKSSKEGTQLWSIASEALQQGDVHRATRHLERLVREESGTVEGDRARLALAQTSVQHSAHRRALDLLKRRTSIDEFDRLSTMALAFEGLENYREAAKVWLEAVKAAENSERGGVARKGAARTLFLGGNPSEAEATLNAADTSSLEVLVEPSLHPKLLERLYREVGQEDPWHAWLALKHARTLMSRGEGLAAREAVVQAQQPPANPHIRQEAKELLGRIEAWDRVSPRSVGVLLPLSGKHSGLIRGIRAALELAFAKDPSLKPIFRDTQGNAAHASKMANELIFQDHVAMIVGPIGHFETEAVVSVTRRFHIPHIHLSSKHETGDDSPSVWRFRVSAREYGALMAKHAVEVLGRKRFAILCPTHTHGYEAMGAFWDQVVALGGEVTAFEFYDSKAKTTKDLSPFIPKLLHARKPGKLTVNFDALFVPGSARQMRIIAPILKFWGVRLQTDPGLKGTTRNPFVQLLGGSSWHRKWLIDRGEDLVDNGIFASPFHYDPNDPHADEFVINFRQSSGQKPLPIHAEVYDAASLAVLAMMGIAGNDHRSRHQVIQNLLNVGEVKGATGLHRVTGDAPVHRRPWLMTVDLDDIRPRLPLVEEIERRRMRGHTSDSP
jgi:branched-chain amino acid transport system substrate-binding protein